MVPIAEDGESQSSFTLIMPGSLTGASLSLWGVPEDDKLAATKDVLTLSATIMKTTEGVTAVSPTLQYLVSGFSDQWIAPEGAEATKVTLSDVELANGSAHVTGSFSAELFHSTDPMGQEVDSAQMKEISGAFDVTLPTP